MKTVGMVMMGFLLYISKVAAQPLPQPVPLQWEAPFLRIIAKSQTWAVVKDGIVYEWQSVPFTSITITANDEKHHSKRTNGRLVLHTIYKGKVRILFGNLSPERGIANENLCLVADEISWDTPITPDLLHRPNNYKVSIKINQSAFP